MASAKNPGGNYKGGAGAQEENLHRRTNLFQCLEDVDKMDKQRTWKYPIDEWGGIFSPGVTVFRGSEQKGYYFMKQPMQIDVISVAAYRHPETFFDKNKQQHVLSTMFAANTKKKMRIIFKMALQNKCTSLVLSALGCGAYRNPPEHIAQLFKEVIQEYEGCFEHIYFAIFDDHNANKKHNPQGNIAPFEKVFGIKAVPIQYSD